MTEPSYRFDDAIKDPGEDFPVFLDCFPICAAFWRANKTVLLNEHVRPIKATGFAYRGSAGLTGSKEPRWPVVLGGSVQDGSVLWTAVAPAANALNVLSSLSATSDPVGLTIGSLAVSDDTKIAAMYSGGTLGQDYDAVFSFLLDGVIRIARQAVKVRKR